MRGEAVGGQLAVARRRCGRGRRARSRSVVPRRGAPPPRSRARGPARRDPVVCRRRRRARACGSRRRVRRAARRGCRRSRRRRRSSRDRRRAGVRSSSHRERVRRDADGRRTADRDRVRPPTRRRGARSASAVDRRLDAVVVVGAGEVQRARRGASSSSRLPSCVSGARPASARWQSMPDAACGRGGDPRVVALRAAAGDEAVGIRGDGVRREQRELARLVAAEREPGEVVALHEQRRAACRAPRRAGPSARAASGGARARRLRGVRRRDASRGVGRVAAPPRVAADGHARRRPSPCRPRSSAPSAGPARGRAGAPGARSSGSPTRARSPRARGPCRGSPRPGGRPTDEHRHVGHRVASTRTTPRGRRRARRRTPIIASALCWPYA